ncbi:MAG: ABC transporter substrate-binding protein [Rhizobiales bacterium]|nr:ABC transporter substrate-binding protein [Hyphomicrobiales bacterium]
MIKKMLAAALALGVSATAAFGAEKIKIGVITTLTTPAAVLGNEQMNGFNLALKHLDNKIGGLPVEMVVEDDGFKPEIGKQKADKLVKQDNVDVVTGLIWSHVMLASANSVLKGGKFLISANAGHSKMAGKNCHKNFFNTSWQNDTVPMALGEVLNQEGVKSVYIMSPNYAAGKDMAKGVERTFKGEIKGKDFTKWGKDAQLDFSAELAKAKASGAEAIFVFYPGKAGGAFMKQFGQAGLRDTMKLFTVFTVDGISLPKFQAANMTGVLGSLDTMHWNVDFDNAQNKRFVADFLAEHGRYPSFYASQAYDTLFFLDSAVKAVGGKIEDQDALRAALMKADYPSVRGSYKYGNNHFPIQNFVVREVVEGADGKWTHKTKQVVLKDFVDPHAQDCKM